MVGCLVGLGWVGFVLFGLGIFAGGGLFVGLVFIIFLFFCFFIISLMVVCFACLFVCLSHPLTLNQGQDHLE